jgi:hypothetical protein
VGAQYTAADYTSMATNGYNLPLGTTTYNAAATINASEFTGEQATAGWYLQETLNLNQRLFLTAAVRGDASSSFGSSASTVAYPKWNASWLVSQEPFFPRIPGVSSLRLRVGYGNAGSQPPFDQRFRTYLYLPGYANGTVNNSIGLSTVGNPDLLPEKSSETEGGFDLGLGDDRVTFGMTLANKVTHNALVTRTLPPSFGPPLTQMQNIGKIQNRNLEIEATAHPIETSLLDWSSSVTLSRTKNKVITLGAAGPSPVQYGILNAQSRYAGGYPVDGLWARAVTGFADVNGDGILESDEVQLSDSLIYAGHTSPSQNIGWQNSVSLWSGRLLVSANFTYEGGATQYNELLASQCLESSCIGAVDSSASLSDQLLAQSTLLTGWPYLEQVSVFRFDELSFTVMAPPALLRSLRVSTASVSLMGRNLKLWTHYRGADPDVNTSSNLGGDNVADGGGIPQPRQWFLRVHLGF